MSALASAVYEGVVTHRRHAPRAHAFRYRMAQLLLDLDEIEAVFRHHPLWSANRRNLAEWRRDDYLGPTEVPLAEAVRERVCSDTGIALSGPIRMLAHPRYAGYVFNPVTFYYCYESDGITLACIVAEITNTLAKDKEISDRWRGFADIADSRHLANRVEREVVDALAAAIR